MEFRKEQVSPQQMLDRATDVFIGVIERHDFEWWPLLRFRVSGIDHPYWRILRRRVRVEIVARGSLRPRAHVDVHEYFWTGGTSGDWNHTSNGMRALFMVRREGGRLHVVQDWWRSIFPVTSGYHSRLPLTETAPLWERVGLLNLWFSDADFKGWPGSGDPGQALSLWRQAKLWRGMVRHPSMPVRVAGCRQLTSMGLGLDECWDELSAQDRSHFPDGGYYCCTDTQFAEERRKARQPRPRQWELAERDIRRLLTTVSDPNLRKEFCRLYIAAYPTDAEHGCPAERRPPAAIVTEAGEIALP